MSIEYGSTTFSTATLFGELTYLPDKGMFEFDDFSPRFELGGIPPAPRGQPQIEVRKLGGGCE